MADQKDTHNPSPEFQESFNPTDNPLNEIILTEQALSSDAEYLLLSTKTDVDQLSKVLVEEYYASLFRLAVSRIQESPVDGQNENDLDPQTIETMARELVCRSLAYAVSHSYEYSKQSSDDQKGFNAWLELILRSQEKGTALTKKQVPDPARSDLSPNGSYPLIIKKVSRQARSMLVRQNRLVTLKTALLVGSLFLAAAWIFQTMGGYRPSQPAQSDTQETAIAEGVIADLLPAPPTPTPLWQENVIYSSLIPESVAKIAERFNLSESSLRQLNDYDGVRQEFPEEALYLPVPEIYYPDNMPHPQLFRQSLPALDESSTPQEIADRLSISHRLWRTLYIDVQLLSLTRDSADNQYVPGRSQVWVVQPDRSLEISGYSPGLAGERSIILKGRHYFTATGFKQPVQTVGLPERDMLIFNPLLRELAFPMNALLKIDPGKYKNLGMQTVAGREALAVDWYNANGELEYHLWIEPQTGLLLRLQQLEPYSGFLLNDRLVTHLEVNFEPPASSFFDPLSAWSETFAQDQTGEPEPDLALKPTPTFAFP